MLTAMLALRAHQDVPHEPDDNIVSETWLAGVKNDYSKSTNLLFELENVFYPALCRNYVTSQSDLDGNVAYRLTETGREVLDHPDVFSVDSELPTFDVGAVDLYFEAIQAAREELQTAKPEKRNAIAPRLSNGLWPEDSDAAPIPPVFTKDGRVRSLKDMQRAIAKLER
jgi:hypothetical protein